MHVLKENGLSVSIANYYVVNPNMPIGNFIVLIPLILLHGAVPFFNLQSPLLEIF